MSAESTRANSPLKQQRKGLTRSLIVTFSLSSAGAGASAREIGELRVSNAVPTEGAREMCNSAAHKFRCELSTPVPRQTRSYMFMEGT